MAKYRDDMTPAEVQQLLDELAKLDEAYNEAGPITPPEEGSLEYFNRYIAGDRKG